MSLEKAYKLVKLAERDDESPSDIIYQLIIVIRDMDKRLEETEDLIAHGASSRTRIR